MNNFTESLKSNNLKLTSARKIVFDALSKSSRALSPKEVFQAVNDKTDLVSVYRNLSLFADIGVAHRFQDGRYSLCQHQHDHSKEAAPHIHIITHCLDCGLTREIEKHSSELCDIATKLSKYSAPLSEVTSIVIQGNCPNCDKAKS
ncbi:MAG: transcriptional repressor [Bdellovibrionales bacterium]|nr:transcriptional repressor [Bdellovibrionales bacterium]NQZ19313.1 transcriptional repressor [Bdellovibrionales bacterium]